MSDINEWWLQGRIGAISPLIPDRKTSFCKVTLVTSTRIDHRQKDIEDWHEIIMGHDVAEQFLSEAAVGKKIRCKGYLLRRRIRPKNSNISPESQMIATWYSIDCVKRFNEANHIRFVA